MDDNTRQFRNHLYSNVWQYILKVDNLNAYMQTEEGFAIETEDFYASEITELIRRLSDNYEFHRHYQAVIGTLPVEERSTIQHFMAWYNINQDVTFTQIYSAMSYDNGFDMDPLYGLMEQTKTQMIDPPVGKLDTLNDGLEFIFKVIDKFTSAAASLTKRRVDKQELKIDDEYDMQDLLFVMLKAYFPVVKSEQVVEGNADRQFLKIDFLEPDNKIALECKFHRKKDTLKSLTNQLDIDIQTYHRHSDCEHLIFFIYDKEILLTEANNLEKTYRQKQSFNGKDVNIYVKVRPKN